LRAVNAHQTPSENVVEPLARERQGFLQVDIGFADRGDEIEEPLA
jgi:hypothetical protein